MKHFAQLPKQDLIVIQLEKKLNLKYKIKLIIRLDLRRYIL